MQFLILVLMIICAICMRKLDIENLTKVFVVLCANLFLSFIIVAQCRGTEGEMLAMVFFVVNVLVNPFLLYTRMAKDLPTHRPKDPNAEKMNIMDRIFKG